MNGKANMVKEGKNKMENIIEVLNVIPSKEGKLYWLKVIVKTGEITQGQAGMLAIKFDLF